MQVLTTTRATGTHGIHVSTDGSISFSMCALMSLSNESVQGFSKVLTVSPAAAVRSKA